MIVTRSPENITNIVSVTVESQCHKIFVNYWTDPVHGKYATYLDERHRQPYIDNWGPNTEHKRTEPEKAAGVGANYEWFVFLRITKY